MNSSVFEVDENPANRILSNQGKTYLYFGGTAYLALATHPEFKELFIKGVRKYGVNIGTSRLNNVQLHLYEEAEKEWAQRFDFESSILTSSGYLASQLVYQYYAPYADEIFVAPATHPANTQFGSLPETMLPRKEWEIQTLEKIQKSHHHTFLIFSNSLNNLYPEKYDFSWLNGVDSKKKIILVMDDSHGIGIIRENKPSISLENIHSENIEVIIVASLAKGFNTDAGVVLSSKKNIDDLRTHPVFIGASPPSPAGIFALLHSKDIYESQREKLMENLEYFKSLSSSLLSIQNFPVFTFLYSGSYQPLLDNRVLISSFPYPNPSSTHLDRIVLSADHSKKDLEQLSGVLKTLGS